MPHRIALRVLLGLVLPAAVAAVLIPAPASAAKSPWTEPVVIYSTTGVASNPILVADPSGDLHFFVTSISTNGDGTLASGSPGSLVYSRLHAGRWSPPVDILVTPGGGQVSQPSVALDDQGYLHVVWKGGAGSQLYYSRAYVTEAGSAAGWTTPTTLSDEQLAPGTFGIPMSLVSSHDGKLHLVYATFTGNLDYIWSADGGWTWSRPGIVRDVAASPQHADLPRLATGPDGHLYLTWTELQMPHGWPPTGAFSSRSEDNGESWLKPVRLDGANYGEINVVAAGDTVHFLWDSVAQLAQRKYAQSADAGQTVGSIQPIPFGIRSGGFTGFPNAAVDSADTLHLVTSLEASNASNSGIFHVQWNGASWSQPIYLSTNVVGQSSVEQANIAITLGNLMHVVYEDDSQRIWYTAARSDAPGLPARTIPSPQVRATPTPVSAGTLEPTPAAVTATASPTTTTNDIPSASGIDSGGVSPLLVAAAASILMLGGLLVSRLFQRHD
jgi:hypothetical protein